MRFGYLHLTPPLYELGLRIRILLLKKKELKKLKFNLLQKYDFLNKENK
jgi:hypothetical protein